MMTSDPDANTDAAIHVAHALSVHRIERDLDFLTAFDDLARIIHDACHFGTTGVLGGFFHRHGRGWWLAL
jgi:CRISPR system Cascade subunit CasC